MRGDLEVLPLPARALHTDQPLFIYYEIYNLQRDGVGSTAWEIHYSVAEATEETRVAGRIYRGLRSLVGRGQRRAVLSSAQSGTGIRRDLQAWLEIDIGRLPMGLYELELEVRDRVTGRTDRAHLHFRALGR